MTGFATADQDGPRLGAVLRYLVGIAGLAFSLTALWLSMRAVMDIGGACASGGPYVPAVECPDVIIALTPLSIFGIFIFGGLAFWGGASLGAGWVGIIALVWPALFLSLGWNFLEYGLNPPGAEPGELEWGWLVCAVVFGLMGGGPLLVALWGLREASRGRERDPGSHYTRRVATTPRGGFELHRVAREPRPAAMAIADRLQRLARLRDAGDLTDAEFEAAKRATLDEAGA
jgi:hypothetical protein